MNTLHRRRKRAHKLRWLPCIFITKEEIIIIITKFHLFLFLFPVNKKKLNIFLLKTLYTSVLFFPRSFVQQPICAHFDSLCNSVSVLAVCVDKRESRQDLKSKLEYSITNNFIKTPISDSLN